MRTRVVSICGTSPVSSESGHWACRCDLEWGSQDVVLVRPVEGMGSAG